MLLEVTSWKAKVAKAAQSKAKVTKVKLGIFLMNTLYLQAQGLTEGGTVTISTSFGGTVLIAFPILPTDSWPLECHQLGRCGFCHATHRR